MSDYEIFWTCEFCHFDNNNDVLICTMCELGANPDLDSKLDGTIINENKSDDIKLDDTIINEIKSDDIFCDWNEKYIFKEINQNQSNDAIENLNAWDTLSEDSDSIVQVIDNYAILMFLILL